MILLRHSRPNVSEDGIQILLKRETVCVEIQTGNPPPSPVVYLQQLLTPPNQALQSEEYLTEGIGPPLAVWKFVAIELAMSSAG